jgi:hypothetical protein
MRKGTILMLLASILFLASCLLVAQTKNKIWYYKAGKINNGSMEDFPTEIYFIEDQETGTRCYAVRGVEAAAISCVKK